MSSQTVPRLVDRGGRASGRQTTVREPVAQTARPAGHTILLVEDNLPIRRLMKRGLEAEGYHVLEASHGREALGLIACHGPIDLLLTDIVMPGMDGFTLADRLVELRPETRVLLISGFAEQSVGVHGGLKEAGYPFLLKPFTQARLRAEIREQLGTAITARQAQIVQLQSAFEALQAARRPKPKRRPMSAAQRTAMSRRLKAYWAKRRQAAPSLSA